MQFCIKKGEPSINISQSKIINGLNARREYKNASRILYPCLRLLLDFVPY
jgi:hypothetical protein